METPDPRKFGLNKAAYSVNEALAITSLGRTKFYGLIATGELRGRKVGSKTVILATDLAAFLNGLPIVAKDHTAAPAA